MRLLLHSEIANDKSLCEKKGWYRGLPIELERVYKLLKINRQLPGQTTTKGVAGELGHNVFHAYIALPLERVGGRGGARIVYCFKEDYCLVVYVGGHKDKRYDDGHALSELVIGRLNVTEYLEWVGPLN